MGFSQCWVCASLDPTYLIIGGRLVGVFIQKADETTATRYFHTDHLGSISVITNESGGVVERLSFDAWGKRRNPDGSPDPAGAITSEASRGFTGHEQLDQVGLIHMNGRVYDPLLARFGTPDPMTENPFSTQGWNRYSYVGNSPVNFTDPSGYCFMGCFWQPVFRAVGNFFRRNWGAILQIAATAMCGGNPVCGMIVGGITSAVVTGITSGNWGLAFRAGLVTAATIGAMWGVGELTGGFNGVLDAAKGGHGPLSFGSEAHLFNMAGHALVGCARAVASRASCGSGALAGAIGPLVSPALQGQSFGFKLAANSVLGGLASMAGGGDFANGALTAAFGYLFNEVGLACRNAGGTGGGAAHCGLFIFDRNGDDLRNATVRAQFSLAGEATVFNTDPEGTSRMDLEAFRSGNRYFGVDVPHGMSPEAFEAAVLAAATGYRGTFYDAVFGPNSNSAVGYTITNAGGTLPGITGWNLGAPQLGYYLSNPYPAVRPGFGMSIPSNSP